MDGCCAIHCTFKPHQTAFIEMLPVLRAHQNTPIRAHIRTEDALG